MQAKGYSLWVMPSGEVYTRLAQTILQLSAEHSTPAFEPHVTVLGGVLGDEEEIASRCLELSRALRPYEVRLASVDYRDEYFRCLFLRAEETEDVREANRKAREVFGRREDPPYLPHLSLMYGNLAVETKQRIVAEIGERFDLRFWVRSIHLFSTQGEPRLWRRVKEFALP